MSENGYHMTKKLIVKLSRQTRTAVKWILDRWDQFLETKPIQNDEEIELGYAFYHETYNDFLHSQEIIQDAGIDLRILNGNMADEQVPPDIDV
ncbi:MAG: hypothetical protein AAF298_09930 [Cyanobacteria bacterium P01_A01_bin.40]